MGEDEGEGEQGQVERRRWVAAGCRTLMTTDRYLQALSVSPHPSSISTCWSEMEQRGGEKVGERY